MFSSFRFHRLLTIFAILSGFGIGYLVLPLATAMAAPQGFGTNVVVMDCSETESDTFEVEDISSTEDVNINLEDDCALALQTLLVTGYSIVPGGGGGVHAADEDNEHILYTLVKRGFGNGSKITPFSFNFSNP